MSRQSDVSGQRNCTFRPFKNQRQLQFIDLEYILGRISVPNLQFPRNHFFICIYLLKNASQNNKLPMSNRISVVIFYASFFLNGLLSLH